MVWVNGRFLEEILSPHIFLYIPEKNGREGKAYTKGWENLVKLEEYMQIMTTVKEGRKKFGQIFLGR